MQIALYKPEIPPNTGNISRLCVLTKTPLHIIDKPSFSLTDKAVKRAGLDYWDQLDLQQHENWTEFQKYESIQNRRIYLITRFAHCVYSDVAFRLNDVFVFGNESSGLPAGIVDRFTEIHPEQVIRIPVRRNVRSLNLSNAVSIVLFEALRQNDFKGLDKSYQK